MSLLRREAAAARHATPEPAPVPSDHAALQEALRRDSDPDPIVEEAAERLRDALTWLDARDEWGRPLAWRQVARIAIGPLLAQLRDAQTAAVLSAATDTAVPCPAPAALEPELFATQRAGDDTDLPFGIA